MIGTEPANFVEGYIGELTDVSWLRPGARPRVSVPMVVRWVTNRDEAAHSLVSDDWGAVQEAAARAMRKPVRLESRRRWNDYARALREALTAQVLPLLVEPLRTQCGTSHELAPMAIAWDLQHAGMERVYADEGVPLFFGHLLRVYEAGCLPCGWEGPWPTGELVVFEPSLATSRPNEDNA